jgi:cytochrome c
VIGLVQRHGEGDRVASVVHDGLDAVHGFGGDCRWRGTRQDFSPVAAEICDTEVTRLKSTGKTRTRQWFDRHLRVHSMRIAKLLLGAALGTAASAAGAQSVEGLLKNSGCTACHAADGKLVGPSFSEVAAKYRGDASAPAKLAAKVKAGGSGVWGSVPMPPNPAVKDDDMKRIVAFILSSK